MEKWANVFRSMEKIWELGAGSWELGEDNRHLELGAWRSWELGAES